MAPSERGVRKIGNFWPISRRISETVQDKTIGLMGIVYALSFGTKIIDLG